MAKKTQQAVQKALRLPKWMVDAIDNLAEKGGYTFTDVVIELLRRELEIRGYQMDIGGGPSPQGRSRAASL
ncbi:MAG: ribbon-helix-helix domain-containing protein [Treponema sp.]|nr:ribbon-helix-helix domain-containing protein [Treponema sp.]